MHWPETFSVEHEYRTLILAPTGNDARLTSEFLASSRLAAQVTATAEELCEAIFAGCGAVVLAEEALSPGAVDRLFGLLQHQPPWSDLPLILITTGGLAGAERARRLAAYGTNGNVSVLERPFRPSTLVSAVEAALRARRRQYQARKMLDELGRAREEAERANRAKDDFLAALSHELRTPLSPVLLLASEHAADPSLPPALRKDFEQIARNVTLEARLIDDLLDLTRITKGKLSLRLDPLDAHAALREALATTAKDIAEKQLNVVLELRAERSTIAADAVRLQQIFWNVLKNAAKFTPAGGRIVIATADEKNHFLVRVSDSGVGMEPEEIGRVFDAFTQGDHARPDSRHRFGGLGLGLAICRALIEAHGGQITATSAGRNLGSTFSLRFPAAISVEKARPLPPLAAKGRRAAVPVPSRVLVVDDHESTRVALRRLLERRGFLVATAGSVAEARTVLRGARFDLLISDVGLPDGSGYELMAGLRGTAIKGIALSGYGTENDMKMSREAGFVRHLTKPVHAKTLEAALESLAETR